MVPFWLVGDFTTHFSGEWDVHWGLTELDGDLSDQRAPPEPSAGLVERVRQARGDVRRAETWTGCRAGAWRGGLGVLIWFAALMWQRVKNRVTPKWKPGSWNQGLNPAGWWNSFDPYQCVLFGLSASSQSFCTGLCCFGSCLGLKGRAFDAKIFIAF